MAALFLKGSGADTVLRDRIMPIFVLGYSLDASRG
jgi:hypothetical protein